MTINIPVWAAMILKIVLIACGVSAVITVIIFAFLGWQFIQGMKGFRLRG